MDRLQRNTFFRTAGRTHPYRVLVILMSVPAFIRPANSATFVEQPAEIGS
jgi:hypothetical protein